MSCDIFCKDARILLLHSAVRGSGYRLLIKDRTPVGAKTHIDIDVRRGMLDH